MPDSSDLIVLGSGPAGFVVANSAAQLGFKTAIVERDKPSDIATGPKPYA